MLQYFLGKPGYSPPRLSFPLSQCIFINLELKSPKQLCDFQKCLKCASMKILCDYVQPLNIFILMKRLKLCLFCCFLVLLSPLLYPHNHIMVNKKAQLEYNRWFSSFIRIIVFHHTVFSIFFL